MFFKKQAKFLFQHLMLSLYHFQLNIVFPWFCKSSHLFFICFKQYPKFFGISVCRCVFFFPSLLPFLCSCSVYHSTANSEVLCCWDWEEEAGGYNKEEIATASHSEAWCSHIAHHKADWLLKMNAVHFLLSNGIHLGLWFCVKEFCKRTLFQFHLSAPP